ncbi:zinc finger and SCAN domain-containing protein 12-like [Hypomesus transpacificus]|uniref:zinc finger and SCAN domain-containing protein 12-like n=1 Tax=Hypomesus transpacificus TaxID=137520 RepID=UPI001F072BC5|nr:zinc finger and SCAN domain-containing protein 12-like [Hypomesus transpacificus]
MVSVDVTEFLVSLLDVHKLQLQALTKQGEIQAKVLRQVIKDGLSRRSDVPSSRDTNKQGKMTVMEEKESAEWCARLAELLQAEVHIKSNFTGSQRLLPSDSQPLPVEDQGRRDFLSLKYDPHKGVRELGLKLDSAAKRWLRPDLRSAAQVEQCVAMEHFLSLLPHEAAVWVQKQHPRDMEEAISLAERWIGCGDSLNVGSMDTQTDSEHGSPNVQQQRIDKTMQRIDDEPDASSESFDSQMETVKLESGQLSLEVSELEAPSLEEEHDESSPQEVVPFVCKQEVEEPDFTQESVWAQERSPAEAFHMSVGSLAQGSMSVSDLPPECCSLISTLPTTSSQASPQSPASLVRDLYYQCVKDSPLTARRRGVSASMMDPEANLSAGYTGQFSENVLEQQQTWKTPPSGPSPILNSHLSLPSHQCPDCGCCFTQQRSLQEHRNIHTGERPFVCDLCGKAFCHRRTLNKHTRIHSRERPFHCDYCGQTFKLKDTMKRHQMAHCRHTP